MKRPTLLSLFLLIISVLVSGIGGATLFHHITEKSHQQTLIKHEAEIISYVLSERLLHLKELTTLQAHIVNQSESKEDLLLVDDGLAILSSRKLVNTFELELDLDEVPSRYAAKSLIQRVAMSPEFVPSEVELHGKGEDMVVRTAVRLPDNHGSTQVLLLDWSQKSLISGLREDAGQMTLYQNGSDSRWAFGELTSSSTLQEKMPIQGTPWSLAWQPRTEHAWEGSMLNAGLWPFLISSIAGLLIGSLGLLTRDRSLKKVYMGEDMEDNLFATGHNPTHLTPPPR